MLTESDINFSNELPHFTDNDTFKTPLPRSKKSSPSQSKPKRLSTTEDKLTQHPMLATPARKRPGMVYIEIK